MDETDWQAELRRAHARVRQARMILGVGPKAGTKAIRRAFRRASRATHPDLHPHDTDDGFRLIHCAYAYLMHGAGGEELDALFEPDKPSLEGGYYVEHEWGYWCWWCARFFHEP